MTEAAIITLIAACLIGLAMVCVTSYYVAGVIKWGWPLREGETRSYATGKAAPQPKLPPAPPSGGSR